MSIQDINDLTFISKDGLPLHIKDVLDEKELWESKNRKGSSFIISHAGFEKIAQLAGISLDYDVKESDTVQPSYKNELEHIVRVTIYRRAKHGTVAIDDSFTATGTANRINTSGVGRKYIRLMAEKRGFDIAVKKLLGLSGIYSEAESSDFENVEENPMYAAPKTIEFENISDDINSLMLATNVKELNTAAKAIKKKKMKGDYTFSQENLLKKVYANQFILLNKPF